MAYASEQTFHTYVPLHCYCNLNTDPVLWHVIKKTAALIYHAFTYMYRWQICPQMPHMQIISCSGMTQLCHYICLILTQCSQIKHICPTALLSGSTYRPHSTGHIHVQKRNCNFWLPCYCHTWTRNKYAPQMLNMPIC